MEKEDMIMQLASCPSMHCCATIHGMNDEPGQHIVLAKMTKCLSIVYASVCLPEGRRDKAGQQTCVPAAGLPCGAAQQQPAGPGTGPCAGPARLGAAPLLQLGQPAAAPLCPHTRLCLHPPTAHTALQSISMRQSACVNQHAPISRLCLQATANAVMNLPRCTTCCAM